MLQTGIYVRVSTEEQAEEGFSIKAQEQKLRSYAKIKEWPVYDIYIDPGISGKNIRDRPDLNRLIGDIKKGRVKNVLVYKIDRLTRSIADLMSLIDLFNEYDCAFNSLTESIDTQSATGRMFIKIIGIFAEFERESISERTKLGFERKAKEGLSVCTWSASYGYDRKKGEKVQTVNEKEAVIVREVFDMFVNRHMSYLEIARKLNDRHIPSKTGSVWYAVSIKDMLTNCNYMGNVRYAMEDEKRHFETKGVHQPIITKELYGEAQDLISKISARNYTKHPKEEHYYAGILYCAKCGGKLQVHGTHKNDKNSGMISYGGYRCYNATKKTCDASSVRHIHVEETFISYIEKYNDFDTLDEAQLATKEHVKNQNLDLIKSLRKDYEKLERREKEQIKLYLNEEIEFEDYMSIKSTLEEEKKRISSLLETAEGFVDEELTIKRENIIKSLRENWERLTNIEKRQFLINFIRKITIVNDKPKGKHQGNIKIHDVEICK